MTAKIVAVIFLLALVIAVIFVHDVILDPDDPWIPPIPPGNVGGFDLLMGKGRFEDAGLQWMTKRWSEGGKLLASGGLCFEQEWLPESDLYPTTPYLDNDQIAHGGDRCGLMWYYNSSGTIPFSNNEKIPYYRGDLAGTSWGTNRQWQKTPDGWSNGLSGCLWTPLASPNTMYEMRVWFRTDTLALSPTIEVYFYHHYGGEGSGQPLYLVPFKEHTWYYEYDGASTLPENSDSGFFYRVSYDPRDCYGKWKEAVFRFTSPHSPAMQYIKDESQGVGAGVWIELGVAETCYENPGGVVFFDDATIRMVNANEFFETKVKAQYRGEMAGVGVYRQFCSAFDVQATLSNVKCAYPDIGMEFKITNVVGNEYVNHGGFLKAKVLKNTDRHNQYIHNFDEVNGYILGQTDQVVFFAEDPTTKKVYFSNHYVIIEEQQLPQPSMYTASILGLQDLHGLPNPAIEINGQTFFIQKLRDTGYVTSLAGWNQHIGENVKVLGWIHPAYWGEQLVANTFNGMIHEHTLTINVGGSTNIKLQGGQVVTATITYQPPTYDVSFGHIIRIRRNQNIHDDNNLKSLTNFAITQHYVKPLDYGPIGESNDPNNGQVHLHSYKNGDINVVYVEVTDYSISLLSNPIYVTFQR